MISPASIGSIASQISGSAPPPPTFNWYVETAVNGGSDSNVGNDPSDPFLTLAHALSVASYGESISVGPGTFVETSYLLPDPGVSIYGAGIDITIIQAHSSLYWNYTGSAYYFDKFLFQVNSVSMTDGDQTFKDFTIDGSDKQTRGLMYVNNRRYVTTDNIKFIDGQATGIWWHVVENMHMFECDSYNSGWSSFGFALGGTHLSDIFHGLIDTCYFNEDFSSYGKPNGYGIKCIYPGGNERLRDFVMRDTTVTVDPASIWNGGSAPNIAFEIFKRSNLELEFDTCTFTNHVSFVDAMSTTWTGTPTVFIHDCDFDSQVRAGGGSSYGIELQIGDVVIYNNYFNGGRTGIVQWGAVESRYWTIHHNTFYNIWNFYPTGIIQANAGAGLGIRDMKAYNNTFAITNTNTATYNGNPSELSCFQIDGTCDFTNADWANNLAINTSGGTLNKFINLRTGSNTVSGSLVRYNFGQSMSGGINQGIAGITYTANSTGTAGITGSGLIPVPYYEPVVSGNLWQTGINVGYESPTNIGAY